MTTHDTPTGPPDSPATTLKRSADRRILAGVSGGLGEHFGINAWWFRWSFIILAFFGGAGVALYILAWLLMPKADGGPSIVGGLVDTLDLSDLGTLFGVLLVGAAALIVATTIFNVSGAVIVAVILGFVGVLLYRGDISPPDRSDSQTSGNSPPATTSSETGSGDEPVESTTVTQSALAVEAKPARPPKQRKPKPPPSMLGRLTLAVGLITVATLALLEVADVLTFEPVAYPAAILIIVGLGLLVGTWLGRARWLIVIGFLVTPALLIASLFSSTFDWTFGDPYYRPLSVSEVQGSYSLGFGEITVDLTQLSDEELAEVGSIDVSVNAGRIDVILPEGAGAAVSAEVTTGGAISTGFSEAHTVVGAPDDIAEAFDDCLAETEDYDRCLSQYLVDPPGALDYQNRYRGNDGGWGIDESFEVGPPPHTLELHLKAGAGEIHVEQFSEITVYETDF